MYGKFMQLDHPCYLDHTMDHISLSKQQRNIVQLCTITSMSQLKHHQSPLSNVQRTCRPETTKYFVYPTESLTTFCLAWNTARLFIIINPELRLQSTMRPTFFKVYCVTWFPVLLVVWWAGQRHLELVQIARQLFNLLSAFSSHP